MNYQRKVKRTISDGGVRPVDSENNKLITIDIRTTEYTHTHTHRDSFVCTSVFVKKLLPLNGRSCENMSLS